MTFTAATDACSCAARWRLVLESVGRHATRFAKVAFRPAKWPPNAFKNKFSLVERRMRLVGFAKGVLQALGLIVCSGIPAVYIPDHVARVPGSPSFGRGLLRCPRQLILIRIGDPSHHVKRKAFIKLQMLTNNWNSGSEVTPDLAHRINPRRCGGWAEWGGLP